MNVFQSLSNGNVTYLNGSNYTVSSDVLSPISHEYVLWQKIIFGFFMAVIIVSSIVGKFDDFTNILVTLHILNKIDSLSKIIFMNL